MGQLTRWVLAHVLAQSALWRAEGHDVRVSVNISAGDVTDPGFHRHGRCAPQPTPGSIPTELTLEITETSIIEQFDCAQRTVASLRQLGVDLSIDDFGAGFTSLAYLSTLAVTELKLDRRFITNLTGDVRSRDAELVQAMVGLGHALGLTVVIEGVENDGVLALVRELGADLAQGYGIGRPAPPDELTFSRLDSATSVWRRERRTGGDRR